MYKYILILLVIVFTSSIGVKSFAQETKNHNLRKVKREYKERKSPSEFRKRNNLNVKQGEIVLNILFEKGVNSHSLKFKNMPNVLAERDYEEIRIKQVKVKDKHKDKLKKLLLKRKDIVSVEEDVIYKTDAVPAPLYPLEAGGVDASDSQWHLASTGAFEGYGASKGRSGVIVTIIDEGFDLDHEDLAGKVAFAYNNTTGETGTTTGYQNHGTHCAGIAAASTDNGKGISGAAWKAKLGLISCGVYTDDGFGYIAISNAFGAIVYAADYTDTQVISMSFGGTQATPGMQSAIDQYTEENGIIFVASSGNKADNPTVVNYPCRYNNVICVGATATDGVTRASSVTEPDYWFQGQQSGYGYYVDIFAPGTNIYSTYSANSYTHLSGTSMATPYVAGVIATMLGSDVNLDRSEIGDILRATSTLGTDLEVNGGVIHAGRALQRVASNSTKGWKARNIREGGELRNIKRGGVFDTINTSTGLKSIADTIPDPNFLPLDITGVADSTTYTTDGFRPNSCDRTTLESLNITPDDGKITNIYIRRKGVRKGTSTEIIIEEGDLMECNAFDYELLFRTGSSGGTINHTITATIGGIEDSINISSP